ncbi:helix-turn-helix transcriptional regulator [Tumebacillus sp. ITR2]|uniref:Helix-turn-helix transcriptional regulator n=1 Tax=Tumebacillus amylolyticus TaxID=2801339 RepID=A0ABS1J7X6_9BACL|nr:helix-turn-helix transcriptional regulator [Tumebacillus amylolyticus]MBL0386332.1 helix-turn-helix transcriptional regulator [Tumebacillus amylolyticus]
MLVDKSLSIGQRFKEIRIEKGFSQESLADGLCHFTTVSRIENDRSYPSAALLGKLADKLGVPLREIMGMQEQQLEADFQIEMVRVYIEKADYNHALDLIQQLDQREDLLGHQRDGLVNYRTECQLRAGMFEKAVEQLLPFLQTQQVQQTISDEILCDLYNKLGNAHHRLNGFEKAYSAFEQGYRVSLRIAEFGAISARVTKNFGLACVQLGYKDDAKIYLEKAYSFFEKVADMREVANTLFDMARATGNTEHMTQARFLFESLELVREANLARQYYEFHVRSQVDYKQAVVELHQIASEFEKMDDLGMSFFTLSKAVMIAIQNRDLPLAGECLAEANVRRDALTVENPRYLGYYYRAKSEYNFIVNEFDECVKHSIMSSEMCAIMGMYAESAESLRLSTKVYQLQGDFQKAFEVSMKMVEMLEKGQRR